jgi:hypothetical protein
MAGAAKSKEALVCPECKKEFYSAQALGGHRAKAHGVKSAETLRRERLGLRQKNDAATERRRMVPVVTPESLASSYAKSVRASLRDLVAPLHEQLAEIEARLVVLEKEERDLRDAKRQIVNVIAKIDPTTASSAKSTKQAGAVRDHNSKRAAKQLVEKADALEKILLEEGDELFPNGFTSNRVSEAFSSRIPRGLSTKSAREAIEILRERDVVRADRVVRGGGMQFKLTRNGASHA